MTARNEDDWGFEEGSQQAFYIEAQQRIAKLRRHRSEQLDMVVRESKAAMDNLRKEVAEYQQEQESRETEGDALVLKTIIDSTKRRKDLEERMTAVIAKMHASTKEVEEMIKAGCMGRSGEANKVVEKMTERRA